MAGPSRPGRYAWGWALRLYAECAEFDDPGGQRWAAALRPLADAVTGLFTAWLPKATYPVRYGLHPNTAFALSRSLPHARALATAGDTRLADAIEDAAARWYRADAGYPGGWEPSGSDFLSPALTEAELMALLLPAGDFAGWLTAFLPGIGHGEPAALFRPAIVSDSSDGQIAHLHGLNASRAWCWRRLAETLPAGDPRTGPGRGPCARGRGTAARDRRPLHGRSLAGRLRGAAAELIKPPPPSLRCCGEQPAGTLAGRPAGRARVRRRGGRPRRARRRPGAGRDRGRRAGGRGARRRGRSRAGAGRPGQAGARTGPAGRAAVRS